MSKTVFILGAGASVEAGAPIMNNFLDEAADLLSSDRVDYKTDFELVFKARSLLQATHSKFVSVDLHNMETVFSAFEMGKMLNRVGTLTNDELNMLPAAYRRVIAETLEKKIRFPVEDHFRHPTETHDEFLQLLRDAKRLNFDPCVITFNYDLTVDFAAHYRGIDVDYGLPSSGKGRESLKLLKLHGSLNWGFCGTCQSVCAWKVGDFLQKHDSRIHDPDTTEAGFPLSKHLSNFAHCQNKAGTQPDPFLVPPTWNKSNHQSGIESVWQGAAKELSECENVFIAGYSLPPTDLFFQYLLSLGCLSEKVIRRFWVFDPNPNIEQRYREILGRGVIDRFRFHTMKFSEVTPHLRQVLHIEED